MKNILLFGSFSAKDWSQLKQRQQFLVDFLKNDYSIYYVQRISARSLSLKRTFLIILNLLIKHKPSPLPRGVIFTSLFIIPFCRKLFRRFNALMVYHQLRIKQKKWGIDVFDIIIVSHPADYVEDAIKAIKAKRIIYDCVQRFKFNEYFPKDVVLIDEQLSRIADCVITDSITIIKDKKSLTSKIYRVPQGFDLPLYKNTLNNPNSLCYDLENIPSPRVCYIGAFHQTFDLELVNFLSIELQNIQFVLIGPLKKSICRHLAHSNVHLLGWKDHALLPRYMNQMDGFIIPYRITEHGKGVFPTKLFEYLFFKKPIVVTPLPDVIEYAKYIDIAYNAEQFKGLLELRIINGINKLSEISDTEYTDFLTANSWAERYKTYKYIIEKG